MKKKIFRGGFIYKSYLGEFWTLGRYAPPPLHTITSHIAMYWAASPIDHQRELILQFTLTDHNLY